ncbi:MAG: helix-turn-helix domain-containing protein [Clostridiales bacterium]|nr:helix-turn-helix domain-containing protein [Clostridiales bacterium]
MDTLNQIVAKNILCLREKAGLSQLALALNADITPGALFEIEHTCGNPRINTLSKIASALGVPLHRLFEECTSPSEMLASLMQRF